MPQKKVSGKKKKEELRLQYQEEAKKREETKKKWIQDREIERLRQSASELSSNKVTSNLCSTVDVIEPHNSNPQPTKSNSPYLSEQIRYDSNLIVNERERMKMELKEQVKKEIREELMIGRTSMKLNELSKQMDKYVNFISVVD